MVIQVIRLLKARIKASITCQGICMKSIAAAHLSFLITFHRADSLSQTVMVISWGGEEALTRGVGGTHSGPPFLFPNQET